ncbi:MAG: hypothetical protein QM784_11975 [Polyangiaceae bacterium]
MIRPESFQFEVEPSSSNIPVEAGRSRVELESTVSDVRCLMREANAEHLAQDEGSRQPRFEGPIGLGELLAFAGEELGADSDVAGALRFADLLKASWLLLSERKQLAIELRSAREDFEELRLMYATEQERWSLRLADADDERVALMDRLERAVDEIVSLELRLVETQVHIDSRDEIESLTELAVLEGT